MTQNPVTSSIKKIGRKQELNVIYFLDSNKTRSFKISIRAFRAIVCGLVILLIWSGGSIWFISNLMADQNASDVRIKSYLSTIFKYQSQYDKVYELAYPNSKPQTPYPSVAMSKPKNSKPTSTLAEVKRMAAKNPPILAKKSVKKTSTKVAKPKIAAVNRPMIQVQTAKFFEGNHQLKMRFDIKNMNSPQKASGYLWAVARYIGADGKEHFIGHPKTVQLDAVGRVRQPRRGTRFHMRRFRPVEAFFKAPSKIIGEFKDVSVRVLDSSGKKIVRTFYVPVQVGYTKADIEKAAVPINQPKASPATKAEQPKVDADAQTNQE